MSRYVYRRRAVPVEEQGCTYERNPRHDSTRVRDGVTGRVVGTALLGLYEAIDAFDLVRRHVPAVPVADQANAELERAKREDAGFATSPFTPPPNPLIAQNVGTQGAILCACGRAQVPLTSPWFCGCGRKWERLGGGTGVVWWAKESPPPNVAIQEPARPPPSPWPTARELEAERAAPAGGLCECGDPGCRWSKPARVTATKLVFDAPAPAAEPEPPAVDPPPPPMPVIVHLADGSWGNTRPLCAQPAGSGAVMMRMSRRRYLEPPPPDEARCDECLRRAGVQEEERPQPSAVAAAPTARPRLTIFCQGDED